ncbi:gdsl lipase acylhydrolase family [Trichoderma cornu-damae]|uniref:Gdsl lipase acylhydrolase family n=1 Tax=Trichoderma cornu-damae TaxID=654480 RepID=A0A9P8QSR8_9HYPO|nr:gdsl lipase acylhydrolase family [Trichoderma cornu-damae]
MAKPYPQVILLGDSLFQFAATVFSGFSFQAALQTRWNTANVVQYLPEIFSGPSASSPKIAYLIVLLGANDAVLPLETTSQHVPIETYKENLGKIINDARVRAHNPKILLVTPPPADEIKLKGLDTAQGHASAIRASATTAAYAEKAREVARENPGVVLIDLWQAIMGEAISMSPQDYQPGGPWLGSPENGKQGGLDTLLPDGLHMGGEGYKVFFDEIKAHVGQDIDPENRQDYALPDWRVVNPPGAAVPLP